MASVKRYFMHWMRFWILYFSLTEALIGAKSRNVEIRIPMTGLFCIRPDVCFEAIGVV